MKTFLISVYYQLLTFVRIKKALFFTFVFPVFIYVVFTLIWGAEEPAYARFLLTGVIVMTVLSDALFSVGNVLMEYYQNGLIKFFKVIPYAFMKHIWALLVSRLVLILFSALLTIVTGVCFFHVRLSALALGFLAAGMVCGFVLFSFLGLLLALLAKDRSTDVSITNFVFFVMLFLSDTFYPLSELNPQLGRWVTWLPVSPVLAISRGEMAFGSVMIWIVLLAVLFGIVWKMKKLER